MAAWCHYICLSAVRYLPSLTYLRHATAAELFLNVPVSWCLLHLVMSCDNATPLQICRQGLGFGVDTIKSHMSGLTLFSYPSLKARIPPLC
ncbi:hypothetical protein F4811DRAFT_519984 [Daldinia bambusicola]|nr:hypothetical protein F4811DRAFT_519984 [Daldinia bambusicola]